MYRQVLVPIDGSKESLAAAALARDFLAANLAGSVSLIHVVNIARELSDISLIKPTLIDEAWIDRNIKNKGRDILKPAEVLFQQSGLPVDTIVKWGDPAEQAEKTAREGGFDLIVVGNRGLSAISGMILGSVSSKILHTAKCQVIVIKI